MIPSAVQPPLTLFNAVVLGAQQTALQASVARYPSQDELLQRLGNCMDRHSLHDAQTVSNLKPRGPFPIELPGQMQISGEEQTPIQRKERYHERDHQHEDQKRCNVDFIVTTDYEVVSLPPLPPCT